MSDLVYVPEDQRDTRAPGWRYTPAGWCRLCRGPIIVPRGKVKHAALRNWKRLRRESFEDLGSNLQLYTRARWHSWCWDHASVLFNPFPPAIAHRRGQRFYGCDGCGFPIEYAQLLGGPGRHTCVPWIDRKTFVGWLKLLGDHERMRAGGEVDHITPLWAGGRHYLSNLQVLCRPCHLEKTAREAAMRSRAKRTAAGHPTQQGLGLAAPA